MSDNPANQSKEYGALQLAAIHVFVHLYWTMYRSVIHPHSANQCAKSGVQR